MADISPSAAVKLFNFNVANPVVIALSIYPLFVASPVAVASPKVVILREFISIFVVPFYTIDPVQVNDDVPFIISFVVVSKGGVPPVLIYGYC